jgi:hypothetical protein
VSKTLTAQLIAAYQADGQLESEPFSDVRDRTIHLYASASSKIKGKTSSSPLEKDVSAVSQSKNSSI